MDGARFDELCRRLEALEREKRRWKVIGVTSLTLLGLFLCVGCPLAVGTAVLRGGAAAARQAAEEAREQEERARREAEKARQEAERQKKQAEKPRGTEK